MFKPNSRYLIRSPNGYSPFLGVQKKTVSTLYTITFDDNTSIRCSGGHAFLSETGFVRAETLFIGQNVTGKTVTEISYLDGSFDVYDPVEVEDNNSYYSKGVISHNTEFLGSTHTLISSSKLKMMMLNSDDATIHDLDMDIFEMPIEGHTYCLTADVSEGTGNDYSTFTIIDVTQIPYKLVAKYRNNEIIPMLFPTVIFQAAMMYNEAFVLVEINTIGLQVADILHFELAYENLIKIETKGKQGQAHTPGFKKKIAFGLKHSKATKAIGCANLKTLIESDKLIITDPQVISEFTTFVLTKQTYKAEEGSHDDLAMALVNFGWLTSQRYFKENINNNIRSVLQKEQMNVMDSDIMPVGFVDNGIDAPYQEEMRDAKEAWIRDTRKRYTFDDMNYDWLNEHKL